MGSADWMPRNLDKRVEITFPVEDEVLKQKVIDILKLQLADNLKSHFLQPNSREYAKLNVRGAEKIGSQNEFCKRALLKNAKSEEKQVKRVFEPITRKDS